MTLKPNNLPHVTNFCELRHLEPQQYTSILIPALAALFVKEKQSTCIIVSGSIEVCSSVSFCIIIILCGRIATF